MYTTLKNIQIQNVVTRITVHFTYCSLVLALRFINCSLEFALHTQQFLLLLFLVGALRRKAVRV
jgi:hypothetical protein